MSKIDKTYLKRLNNVRKNNKYLCHAPFVSLKISIDGRVSPCCYNKDMDDIYAKNSLLEIWNGDVFKKYRENIKKNILPSGCRTCENAILNNEFQSVKIHQYDRFNPRKKKVRIIELAMENTCNLECIMCNGHHSSSIRNKTENANSSPSVYGSDFIDELRCFIPDLEQFVFAGGEPFLISSYYKIWEEIIALNPDCEISVVTNGTILNERIRDLLKRGKFRLNLSFDALDKEIYESIRVNARYEVVLNNIKYFGDYMRERNLALHIPICPLRKNRYNIPDLVRFCNQNKYTFNFVHVNGAFNTALWSMSSESLRELKGYYERQDFIIEDVFDRNNISEFYDLVARLDKWIENAEVKEKYQDVFDLKSDMVDMLKQELFGKIVISLNQNYLNRDTEIYNYRNFEIKFNSVFEKLPDYFNSNHFYRNLLGISPSMIIEGIVNMPFNIISEKFQELFFYGQNH